MYIISEAVLLIKFWKNVFLSSHMYLIIISEEGLHMSYYF